jgi:hypothetical protein
MVGTVMPRNMIVTTDPGGARRAAAPAVMPCPYAVIGNSHGAVSATHAEIARRRGGYA